MPVYSSTDIAAKLASGEASTVTEAKQQLASEGVTPSTVSSPVVGSPSVTSPSVSAPPPIPTPPGSDIPEASFTPSGDIVQTDPITGQVTKLGTYDPTSFQDEGKIVVTSTTGPAGTMLTTTGSAMRVEGYTSGPRMFDSSQIGEAQKEVQRQRLEDVLDVAREKSFAERQAFIQQELYPLLTTEGTYITSEGTFRVRGDQVQKISSKVSPPEEKVIFIDPAAEQELARMGVGLNVDYLRSSVSDYIDQVKQSLDAKERIGSVDIVAGEGGAIIGVTRLTTVTAGPGGKPLPTTSLYGTSDISVSEAQKDPSLNQYVVAYEEQLPDYLEVKSVRVVGTGEVVPDIGPKSGIKVTDDIARASVYVSETGLEPGKDYVFWQSESGDTYLAFKKLAIDPKGFDKERAKYSVVDLGSAYDEKALADFVQKEGIKDYVPVETPEGRLSLVIKGADKSSGELTKSYKSAVDFRQDLRRQSYLEEQRYERAGVIASEPLRLDNILEVGAAKATVVEGRIRRDVVPRILSPTDFLYTRSGTEGVVSRLGGIKIAALKGDLIVDKPGIDYSRGFPTLRLIDTKAIRATDPDLTARQEAIRQEAIEDVMATASMDVPKGSLYEYSPFPRTTRLIQRSPLTQIAEIWAASQAIGGLSSGISEYAASGSATGLTKAQLAVTSRAMSIPGVSTLSSFGPSLKYSLYKTAPGLYNTISQAAPVVKTIGGLASLYPQQTLTTLRLASPESLKEDIRSTELALGASTEGIPIVSFFTRPLPEDTRYSDVLPQLAIGAAKIGAARIGFQTGVREGGRIGEALSARYRRLPQSDISTVPGGARVTGVQPIFSEGQETYIGTAGYVTPAGDYTQIPGVVPVGYSGLPISSLRLRDALLGRPFDIKRYADIYDQAIVQKRLVSAQQLPGTSGTIDFVRGRQYGFVREGDRYVQRTIGTYDVTPYGTDRYGIVRTSAVTPPFAIEVPPESVPAGILGTRVYDPQAIAAAQTYPFVYSLPGIEGKVVAFDVGGFDPSKGYTAFDPASARLFTKYSKSVVPGDADKAISTMFGDIDKFGITDDVVATGVVTYTPPGTDLSKIDKYVTKDKAYTIATGGGDYPRVIPVAPLRLEYADVNKLLTGFDVDDVVSLGGVGGGGIGSGPGTYGASKVTYGDLGFTYDDFLKTVPSGTGPSGTGALDTGSKVFRYQAPDLSDVSGATQLLDTKPDVSGSSARLTGTRVDVAPPFSSAAERAFFAGADITGGGFGLTPVIVTSPAIGYERVASASYKPIVVEGQDLSLLQAQDLTVGTGVSRKLLGDQVLATDIDQDLGFDYDLSPQIAQTTDVTTTQIQDVTSDLVQIPVGITSTKVTPIDVSTYKIPRSPLFPISTSEKEKGVKTSPPTRSLFQLERRVPRGKAVVTPDLFSAAVSQAAYGRATRPKFKTPQLAVLRGRGLIRVPTAEQLDVGVPSSKKILGELFG